MQSMLTMDPQKSVKKVKILSFNEDELHKSRKYLITIQNPAIRRALAKFRILNHQLSIELERFKRPPQLVSNHICPVCHLGVVEDEIHFLLIYPLCNDLREPLLKLASTFNRSFTFLTTVNKFAYIMSNENTSMINVLTYRKSK